MKLLEFPLRRHQFTLVAFLCVVALGVYSFLALPREEDPHIKFAAVVVTAVHPGADPVDLERGFARPLEDRISAIGDYRRIETVVVDGIAAVAVEFNADADADEKVDEVRRELESLRPELPAGIRRVELREVSPSLVNILQLAVVGAEAPYAVLETQARLLRDELARVPGIRNADSWAAPRRELRITVDLQRLAAAGLTPLQLQQLVQARSTDIPGGIVDLGTRSFSVQSSGGVRDIEDVASLVVGRSGATTVRLRDVAEVAWKDGLHSYVGRFMGERAVFVTANQEDGTSVLDVQERVDAMLERFERDLPAGVRLERGFEQSRNVGARLERLYVDFGIAVGLVLVTLLPLGLRAAGIVMVSVPLSVAIGLSALHLLGFSLNQITIAGFVLSLGLLVDDSIVVVENIARHLRMGRSRAEAALEGTRQIVVAILGCTATLLFAFLPLAVLPGSPGKFIRVLPITVMTTILGSLLVALLFIPFIASRVLEASPGQAHGSALLQRVMAAIHRYYRPALRSCLARPRFTVLWALGGALAVSGVLYATLGSSLFPKSDTPQFMITVETPNGSSFAETDRALRFVEGRLAQERGVRAWFANLGHGNPYVYYNQIVLGDQPNLAQLFVQAREFHKDETPAMLERLRRDFEAFAGAEIRVRQFVQGTPVAAPVAIRVLGNDLDELRGLAARVEQVIAAVPGAVEVRNPSRAVRTNLRLAPDPQRSAVAGVSTTEFDAAVRLALSGLPSGEVQDRDGETYDIMLRTPVGQRAGPSALEQVQVVSSGGKLVPLSQLAELRFEEAPARIQRYNRQRAVTLEAQVAAGYQTAAVTREVIARLDQMSWPRGTGYAVGGEAEAGQQAFGGIGIAILVALFGVFAILVLEFGDFRSTLIVLTVVPLGVVGGMLMLLLTGNDLSFTAGVGFVALVGIEIKNSILLVDFTNQLRTQGLALDDAIAQAGEIRFLPILLTSATAIGGLLPLALQDSGLYSPMAWTLIGGLVTSTLLARLVTPVVYKLIPPQLAP
ncbi:MAG: hypothetical protein RL026_920 [Pseudomonadota bacterium]